MKYFALVDCNNFYASCERIFRPDLAEKPIVVLSNNDGCIIARSNEAKALDIDMGLPYWKIKDVIKQHDVKVFSSNYPLYGDISERMTNFLTQRCSDIEVYSIDESFLVFSFYQQTEASLIQHCKKLKQDIYKSIGMPVSIGIGRTKTLSKLANHIAKKYTDDGVYFLHPNDSILERIGIEKIWGVGSAYKKRLGNINISTVAQLSNVQDSWMKSEFGVVGLRMIKELNGCSCLALDPPTSSRKNVMVSRSFRRDVYELDELKEAISVYATRLGEKLRRYNQAAEVLTIYLSANSFKNKRKDGRVYFSRTIALPIATSNTNDLIKWSCKAIESLYEKNTNYKKTGILASHLKPANQIQMHLFKSTNQHLKNKKLMKAMDKINKSNGNNTVYFASCNRQQSWSRKAEWESPKYTTRWEDLLTIDLK